MKNIFNGHYKKYDAWYERNEFAYRSELAAIKKKLPGSGKGLEIGVGTGRFAAALGIKYGVDPAKKMLKIAAQRGVKVRQAQGESLPFGKRIFDYVAVIITLSFVRDPGKVLREASRVLKKGGKIVVGIIDRESFLGEYYTRKKGIFYGAANLLSVEEAKDLLIRAGFGKLSYSQTIFRLPDKMRSVHKARKGYGRGGFVVISAVRL